MNESATPEPPSAPPSEQPRTRRALVYSLTALAAVLLFFAAANTWVKRQMLDTDTWVRTSDELLADTQIRGALSQFVVDELYANVDVAAQIDSRLPDQLDGLAAPIASALRTPAVETVDRLLATPAAQEAWSRANRRAHEILVAVLKDDARAGVSTADGTVTIDLRELVTQLADAIGLPSAAIERIPEGAGTIKVLESDELDQAQRAVTLVDWASIWLFVLVVALFAGAVAAAEGWRRVAVRNVGLAVLIVSSLLLMLDRLARTYAANAAEVAANRPVVAQAWWVATQLVREMAWSGVVLGTAIALAAALVGPSRPAVWIRRRISPTVVDSPTTVWAVTATVVLLGVVLTPFDVFATGWGILGMVITVVGAVVALGATCRRENRAVESLDSTLSVETTP